MKHFCIHLSIPNNCDEPQKQMKPTTYEWYGKAFLIFKAQPFFAHTHTHTQSHWAIALTETVCSQIVWACKWKLTQWRAQKKNIHFIHWMQKHMLSWMSKQNADHATEKKSEITIVVTRILHEHIWEIQMNQNHVSWKTNRCWPKKYHRKCTFGHFFLWKKSSHFQIEENSQTARKATERDIHTI